MHPDRMAAGQWLQRPILPSNVARWHVGRLCEQQHNEVIGDGSAGEHGCGGFEGQA